jgi:type III secretion protein C
VESVALPTPKPGANPTFPNAPEEVPARTLDLLPIQDGISTTTAADFIPWAKRGFLIMAENRRVGDVIADLCEQQGIKAIISPSVQGVVSGRFEGKTPSATLEQLSRSFNLMWFYNQGALYVYGAREIVTKLRTIYYANTENTIALLRSFGMVSSDGGVTSVPGSHSIMVSGPPDFVKLVDDVISSADNEAQFHQQGETVIEVFPLKYAWAYDIPLGPGTSGGATGGNSGSSVIKGVATVLNSLVNYGGGASPANYSTLGKPQPMQGALSPQALSSVAVNGFYSGQSAAQPRQGSAVQGSQMSGPGAPGTGPDGRNAPDAAAGPGSQPNSWPEITADVRRNAVVIRDIRENMAFYRSAIEKLDVPARIVEISAAVIDVEAGKGRTLGVDGVGVSGSGYGVAGSSTGNQNFLNGANGLIGNLTGSASNAVTTGTGGFSSGNLNSAPNILASGVFGTTRITATINALEAENKAKTLSRPTVMTLDNFGATITSQETFYVNATGQYVSNLFNISSGLSLQVVPHIIHGNKGDEVYLQVQISDGSVTSQTVGQIPTVQQSTLTTQSLIKREQSLLIGGLFIKVDQKQASGYPWLRSIPILGNLFGVSTKNKSYVERLFLLTPKIVELSNRNLGDYGAYFQPSPTESDAIEQSRNPEAPDPEWMSQEETPAKKWLDHHPGKPSPTPTPPSVHDPVTKPSPAPSKRFLGIFGKAAPSASPIPSPSPTPGKKRLPKVAPSPKAGPSPAKAD